MTPEPEGVTVVYTDGACKGNPGPGGWGWVVPDGPRSNGGEPLTTNQRMELTAALDALRSLPGTVVVVSDSTYVVNCFRDGWWKGWKKRGWKNAKKEPVANRDIWEPLIDLYLSRSDEIEFRWVKGHAGNEWNEVADKLAVAGAESQIDDSHESAEPSRESNARIVAVFGVQPTLLGGYDDNPIRRETKRRLSEILAAKRQMHPDLEVMTGLRLGVETIAAEVANEIGIPYVVVLPFPDPDSKWPRASRSRFADLVAGAVDVVTLGKSSPRSPRIAGQALSRRNAWMAGEADEAIVVWDRADPWISRLVDTLEKSIPDDVTELLL